MSRRSRNLVILLGTIGSDAESKSLPSGKTVTRIRLATSRNVKSGAEWKEETDWHSVVAWEVGKLAPYLVKGQQVYIEGRLEARDVENSSGQKTRYTDVVSDQIILLGPKTASKQDGGGGDDDNSRW